MTELLDVLEMVGVCVLSIHARWGRRMTESQR
jgi:hypothetical protein